MVVLDPHSCGARTAVLAGVILFSVGCHGAPGTAERTSQAAAAITGAQGPPPDSLLDLTVHGLPTPNTGQNGSSTASCHAVLIDPHLALTAAHCFGNMCFASSTLCGQIPPSIPAPPSVAISIAGSAELRNVSPSQIHFHPSSGTSETDTWTKTFTNDGINAPFDLALVELDPPITDHQPAMLWNPPGADGISLQGEVVTTSGANGDTNVGDARGSEAIIGPEFIGSGFVLQGNRTPSGVQEGDSGGGVFLDLVAGDPSAPPSVPFNAQCAPNPGGAGDTVLVAINHSVECMDGASPCGAPTSPTTPSPPST